MYCIFQLFPKIIFPTPPQKKTLGKTGGLPELQIATNLTSLPWPTNTCSCAPQGWSARPSSDPDHSYFWTEVQRIHI